MLVLLLAEPNNIVQEDSRKQNSVWACSTGYGKVIFALREKILILQVSSIPINIWELSFQKPLTWAFKVWSGGNNRSQNRCKSRRRKRSDLKDGSNNLLKVILQVLNHGGVGRARNNKQSNDRCNSGSRNMYCGRSRGATVATLGGGSASKLIFTIKKRILAKTATNRGSTY